MIALVIAQPRSNTPTTDPPVGPGLYGACNSRRLWVSDK